MSDTEEFVVPTEKFLITGASGQLGYELHQQLKRTQQSLPKTRDTLNIGSFKHVYEWLKTTRPDAIVNCAGYTNVAGAERDQQTCWLANTCGVNNLACSASKLDIPLIHISTDFVFGQDMRRRRPYRESDPVSPLGYYGLSKANGEHALLTWASMRQFPWWIIRCGGMFERPWRPRSNFPNAIRQALQCRAQKTVQVIGDVRTNLTYTPHLARVILWLLKNREQIPSGIYHVTNAGECTWYEVAEIIARQTRFSYKLRCVPREEYLRIQSKPPCTSPKFTCLSMERYEKLGGPPMPPWQDAVKDWCFRRRKHEKREFELV